MLATIFGVFLILHGLVHLLYAGQSWELFELRPEMTWPEGSWLISKILGDQAARMLATGFLVLSIYLSTRLKQWYFCEQTGGERQH